MNPGINAVLMLDRLRQSVARWLLSFDKPIRSDGKPNFSLADRHALRCPEMHTKSVKALGKYLAEGLPSEAMRARSIYRWITANIAYNADALRTGNILAQSPEETLRTQLGVCQHYAELFEALATVAGLGCKLVSGNVRRGGQVPGADGEDLGHAWNAIRLDGYWRLLDVTWGSGTVDGHWRFHRRFSTFYFLTPPNRLLYTHFPDDPAWQLVPNRISRREFEMRPVLSGQFFSYGLDLEEPQANGTVTDGSVRIRIKAPPYVLMKAQLICNGRRVACAGISEWAGRGELRFGLPYPGTFTVQLFARRGPLLPGLNSYDGVLQLIFVCR